MKHLSYISGVFLLYLVCIMYACNSIKEDLSDCPAETGFVIKVIGADIYDPGAGDEKDMTGSGIVRDAVIYLCGEDGVIADTLHASKTEIQTRHRFKLDYPTGTNFKVYCWGNGADGEHHVASLKKGDNISTLLHSLRMSDGYAQSPSDLFSGTTEIAVVNGFGQNHTKEVEIRRRTGTVEIVARNIRDFAGDRYGQDTDEEYQYVLRSTKNGYSGLGSIVGSSVSYSPQIFFNTWDQLITPAFHAIPSVPDEYLEVEIYFKGKLIHTQSLDQNGERYRVVEARHLLIIITFNNNRLDVNITVRPWGRIYQYVEFN